VIELLVLFNVEPTQKQVIVTVDEAGDAGTKSRYFVYGAATLKDAEAFAEVARAYIEERSRLNPEKPEIGFSKAPEYRFEIINNLDPYIGEIYAVAVKKPVSFTTWKRKAMAESSLVMLSDMVAHFDQTSDFRFLVDETSLIKNQRVKEIIETNEHFANRNVDCVTLRSIDSTELQGNDYIVGSIGHEFEKNDPTYKDLLTAKPVVKHVKGGRALKKLFMKKPKELSEEEDATQG